MTTSQRAAVGLAGLVDLLGLAAFGLWGWDTGHATVVRVLLATGTPLVGAIAWGAFCTPTAREDLPPRVVTGVKAVLFGCAVLALAAVGQVGLAIILGALALAALALPLLTPSGPVAGVRG